MEHKQMTASGGIVYYWVDRAGMNSDCIVFTHGVTADHTMFEKQVRFFSGKYTLILWDVPLHGLSRPYHGFSYRDTADILYSILRKEKIEKAVLVGMSMGLFIRKWSVDWLRWIRHRWEYGIIQNRICGGFVRQRQWQNGFPMKFYERVWHGRFRRQNTLIRK